MRFTFKLLWSRLMKSNWYGWDPKLKPTYSNISNVRSPKVQIFRTLLNHVREAKLETTTDSSEYCSGSFTFGESYSTITYAKDSAALIKLLGRPDLSWSRKGNMFKMQQQQLIFGDRPFFIAPWESVFLLLLWVLSYTLSLFDPQAMIKCYPAGFLTGQSKHQFYERTFTPR